MFPISLSTGKGFDSEGFRNYLLELCRHHKKQKRALAFAFIVYDFEDYTIQKILEDKNYWTALDKISGHYLTVFYINSQDSYYTMRQKEIYQEKLDAQRSSKKSSLRKMTEIYLPSTPLDKSIHFLKEELNLDNNLKHPFILFFQSDGEYILDYFVVELKQEKLEDSFLELKRQIESAADSLTQVTADNFKNHQEIFSQLEKGVKGGNIVNVIKSKVIPKIGISTITSFVKLVTGSLR